MENSSRNCTQSCLHSNIMQVIGHGSCDAIVAFVQWTQRKPKTFLKID